MPRDTALPATLSLPRHRQVFSRGPDARQIGLDPATAVAVEGLPPALATLLDELGTGTDTAQLLAAAVRRGATRTAAVALLTELLDAGALHDAAPESVVARRRITTTVVVDGPGPLAAAIGAGLAEHGITVHHGVPAAAGTPARPDLVVLADVLVADPVRVAALLADRVPHLPVRLRDGTGVVGPLVLPGRSTCLRCLDLHRAARDAHWPRVAAQLTTRTGSADPACTAATAALGVAQVLRALTTGPGREAPPTLAATLELDPAAGVLTRRPWPPRADCGCGARRGWTCGPEQPRGTIGR